LKTATVWGSFPGTSDETILVVAHRDGWYDGSTDNASGVATMLGVAEYFAKIPREQRRRVATKRARYQRQAAAICHRSYWMQFGDDVRCQGTRIPALSHATAKGQRFDEFGCATGHKLTSGKMELDRDGSEKLAHLHLRCVEVEKLLASSPASKQ
jgi:hypothetical protein